MIRLPVRLQLASVDGVTRFVVVQVAVLHIVRLAHNAPGPPIPPAVVVHPAGRRLPIECRRSEIYLIIPVPLRVGCNRKEIAAKPTVIAYRHQGWIPGTHNNKSS